MQVVIWSRDLFEKQWFILNGSAVKTVNVQEILLKKLQRFENIEKIFLRQFQYLECSR